MIRTREGFEAYLKSFNSGNIDEFVAKYFVKDAIFEKSGYTLCGAETIATHFKSVVNTVIEEKITLLNYMVQDDLVAAELVIELTAVRDGFYIHERKKGEKEIEYCADFYTVKDNKIAHARIYRRFADENTIDLAKKYHLA